MGKNKIYYCGGYLYQLQTDAEFQATMKPKESILTDFIWLFFDGLMVVRKGYAWDGPSGPMPDLPEFMPASLMHDAAYQLMREGHLPQSFKAAADDDFRRIAIECGANDVVAKIAHDAVDLFGYSSCKKQSKTVLMAP